MAAKAEIYRQMADQATEALTAQVKDWTRFLIVAGNFYKQYGFLGPIPRPALNSISGPGAWDGMSGAAPRGSPCCAGAGAGYPFGTYLTSPIRSAARMAATRFYGSTGTSKRAS